MLFENLKSSLKEKIEKIYLISGTDEYLCERAYKLIIDACKINILDMNIVEYKSGNVDWKDVVNALEILPIMDDKKVVYVDASIKVGKFENVAEIEKYSKSPSDSSVLVVRMGDDTKINLNGAVAVDCNKLSEKFVTGFVVKQLAGVNKTINATACAKLIEYTASNLSRINMEIPKIVSYVGDKTNIDDADIENVVTKVYEYQIFELTEALGKLQKEKVFNIIETLKQKKQNEKMFLPLIYAHFRRLMHIALNPTMSKKQLAEYLNVKEFAITKASQQIGYFTKKRLKEINDWCGELDYQTKNGIIDAGNGIDILILKILNG